MEPTNPAKFLEVDKEMLENQYNYKSHDTEH